MIESIGLIGALAAAGAIVGRVLIVAIVAIALRGTQPSERPPIILALTNLVCTVRRPNRHDASSRTEIV